MEKDLLKELREYYKLQIGELTHKKRLLFRMLLQKEMYEDNPIVQQYLVLNKNIESLEEEINQKKKTIQKKAINQYQEISTSYQEDKKVFVYITDIFDKDNNLCSYYFDIISGAYKEVGIEDKEEFEKNNKVISLDLYIKSNKEIANRFDCQSTGLDDIIRQIQEEFIIDSLENGHTTAVKRILSKGKKY